MCTHIYIYICVCTFLTLFGDAPHSDPECPSIWGGPPSQSFFFSILLTRILSSFSEDRSSFSASLALASVFERKLLKAKSSLLSPSSFISSFSLSGFALAFEKKTVEIKKQLKNPTTYCLVFRACPINIYRFSLYKI